MSEVAKELVRLWRTYLKAGEPYGHSIDGLFAWLEEKELDNV